MTITQQFQQIDEQEKADLLAKYQSRIGMEIDDGEVRELRTIVRQLKALGVDLDCDADEKAKIAVYKLECEMECEPAGDAQAAWEEQRQQIKNEMRSATFAAVIKSISEMNIADAATIGKKLTMTFATQWNWAERVHEVRYEPQRDRIKQIDAVCDAGEQNAVQQIVEIVSDALDEFDENHWKGFVESVVQKNVELDRTPIFACIKSGNAKLNSMDEPPEKRARRNSDRRYLIRQEKQKHPLAFPVPAPVEPPAETPAPEELEPDATEGTDAEPVDGQEQELVEA